MQLLPQPRHSFALIFTVLGFILLPSAWLCAISLASIHLGCMYQGRAALSMVCPVKPTLPKWLKPSVPPATCLLGSQQLQTQASFLAGLSHHSQLAQRMYLSPLQRGSSKTRGLPRTGRWRAAAAEPPHVHGHGVLSHQGSAILHAWIGCNGHWAVILSGPFTNRITDLILKSLSLLPPAPTPLLIFAEMDLQWKYLKRNNYLYEQQQHNACSSGVGYGQRKWALSLKPAFIHVYILTKSQAFANTYKIFDGYGYDMIFKFCGYRSHMQILISAFPFVLLNATL